ncbi:hypothetical protein NVIE_0740 [Nitrososphaera viennensis EN76]|uniref:Uncharacterized protein n=1 Tax=Nitrososphaera viennensis EN76 TaxID=926571 RepID=A0A060HN15_9ARCH|nr:hypothetical protein NVIE_0740 [Nitrososphaera viennensis EN76]
MKIQARLYMLFGNSISLRYIISILALNASSFPIFRQ